MYTYMPTCIFPCLYAWIHVLPCLCARLVHVDVYVSMSICLDLCFHMPICLDRCSLHALCHHLCACVLHAMFMCLILDLVCHIMCYCSPFVLYRIFLCFDLMVRTQSRPYGLCHRPYANAHIKGFGSP